LTEIGAADVAVWKGNGEREIDRWQFSTSSKFEFAPSYETSTRLQQCFPLFAFCSRFIHCSDNTFGSDESL